MADSPRSNWREQLRQQVSPAWLVTRREVRDQFRDWRVIFPILALTLFFPGLMNFTANQAVQFVEQYGAPIIALRLIPFLLMVVGFFPISVSLVIALESFVGEKERRSIEPLLSSPLTDWQLYLGKLLAALLPPLIASYLGIGVYLAGVYWRVGWSPEPVFLLQIVLLTGVQALVMVSGAVVVSSQTTSVRAANLLASFIIIPMALLLQGESVIMFWARYTTLWWVIAGQVVIAALLIRAGVGHFNREELLGRELDTLNLGWGWRIFKRAFLGSARNPLAWYRTEVPRALRLLKAPAAGVGLMLLLAVGIGVQQARVFRLPAELLNWQALAGGSLAHLDALGVFSATGVGLVWFQNARAVTLATLGGIFSFGVLGVVILMLPLALIGYFMGNLAAVGLPPLTFLAAFILPHGVVELPAIVICGAAILRLGATLAAFGKDKTVGEAFLEALADWAKVMVGVVLPLFLVAAALEVLVTPRVAIWLLGG